MYLIFVKNTQCMFKLIAGPCVVESEKMTMTIAENLKDICRIAGVDLIFKASYRKANRTSIGSFEGIGDVKALIILKKVHAELDLKVITDVHTSEEVSLAAEYVDMLQIPAFLCRQTDLIKKASKTGLPINIKKGQFASADTMKHAIQKARECGASEIMITERGTTFGYSDLIVDMRNIPVMNTNGTPVFVVITRWESPKPLYTQEVVKEVIARNLDEGYRVFLYWKGIKEKDLHRMDTPDGKVKCQLLDENQEDEFHRLGIVR